MRAGLDFLRPANPALAGLHREDHWGWLSREDPWVRSMLSEGRSSRQERGRKPFSFKSPVRSGMCRCDPDERNCRRRCQALRGGGARGRHGQTSHPSSFADMKKAPGDPLSRGNPGASFATATWWSWGESNPRPTLSLHAFSGRSLWRRSTRLRHLSQTTKSTSPAWEESRVTSRRRHTARFLDDARIRIGITYGLTDYRARLGSEGEVVALGFGNYCFAESVYEITLHPRPASRGFTGAVETDQPRGSFSRRSRCRTVELPTRMPKHPALQVTTDADRAPFPPARLTVTGLS